MNKRSSLIVLLALSLISCSLTDSLFSNPPEPTPTATPTNLPPPPTPRPTATPEPTFTVTPTETAESETEGPYLQVSREDLEGMFEAGQMWSCEEPDRDADGYYEQQCLESFSYEAQVDFRIGALISGKDERVQRFAVMLILPHAGAPVLWPDGTDMTEACFEFMASYADFGPEAPPLAESVEVLLWGLYQTDAPTDDQFTAGPLTVFLHHDGDGALGYSIEPAE